ncbi:hypothetical protein SS50377_21025 [Spironucleus salmonicida]|uniref:Uncharacterized protein n=1 Tax=Spironucleus salmonicida TaxID=348837 RepID=V6LGQ6_9EUKA|nr:hypothetical protein SS50377_21025 [Spironucleus salmonicida]|eukprot:EST43687.1 Hypothetical protein SS50377_16736 [Spironucleus salmonicida]
MSRGVQFLEQGHFISGFQQISSASQQVQTVAELIKLINVRKSNILNQNTNTEVFLQLSSSINQLKTEITRQRDRINQQIVSQAKFQSIVLQKANQLTKYQEELQNTAELQIIYSLVLNSTQQLDQIAQGMQQHIKYISQGSSTQAINLLPLREIINLVLDLENDKFIKLENLGINVVSKLQNQLKKYKLALYNQIIEPSFMIWLQHLKKQIPILGEKLFQPKNIKIDNKYRSQEEIGRCIQSLNIKDTSFSEQLIEFCIPFSKTLSIPQLEQKVGQIQFFRSFYYELYNFTDSLGYTDQLIESIQSKWYISLKLSLDKSQVSNMVSQYQSIIGYTSISQNFTQLLNQSQRQQLRLNFQENIQQFCIQMSKYQKYSPYLYQSDDDQEVLQEMIHDIYTFRQFLDLTHQHDVIDRIDTVNKHINQYWTYIFTSRLNSFFSKQFLLIIENSFSAHQINLEDQQWLTSVDYYLGIFQKSSIEFQLNLLKILMNYVDYIFIWLNKGQYKTPFIEQVLLLDIYMPTTLSETNFYEILTGINEFYLTSIQQYFEEKFKQCKSFLDTIHTFFLFTQLIPVFNSLNCFIQNSVYFDPASLFSSVLEIIKAKIQQFYILYVVPKIESIIIFIIRTGKLPLNLSIQTANMSIKNFQSNIPCSLKNINMIINFFVSILQFCDTKSLFENFAQFASFCIIKAACHQQKIISNNVYTNMLHHIKMIQGIVIEIEIFKIDDFSLMKNRYEILSKTVQKSCGELFNLVVKKKLSLQVQSPDPLSANDVFQYAEFRAIASLLRYKTPVQIQLPDSNREIKAMKVIDWVLLGKSEPTHIEPYNELYQSLQIGGFQAKKLMAKLIK